MPQDLKEFFQRPVASLRGIRENQARKLENLGCQTWGDLLKYVPKSMKLYTQQEFLTREGPAILRIHAPTRWPQQYPAQISVTTQADEPLTLSYFHKAYGYKNFVHTGLWWIRGDLRVFQGKWTMAHPRWSRKPFPEKVVIYGASAGLSSENIQQWIQEILQELPEWETPWQRSPMGWKAAWSHVHDFDSDQRNNAWRRLAFDEAIAQQWLLKQERKYRQKTAHQPRQARDLPSDIDSLTPWPLTQGQNLACQDIIKDLQGCKPMRRLLQGDVGSGKTAVAWIASWAIALSSGKVAFLAPTEILAQQHYQKISDYAQKWNLSVAVMTGKSTKTQKKVALKADIIVGTHALIQDSVDWQELDLIIIDEQHRFGVRQRCYLSSRFPAAHQLMISATPIPRTLMTSLWGDVDVSIIKDKPSLDQEKIETCIVRSMEKILTAIKRTFEQNRCVYWVCPFVDDNPSSVKNRVDFLKRHFPDKVAQLWGAMPAQDKIQTMERFTQGEQPLLVSTTVIEVGVDVPQAYLMIIEDAGRFGLTQLHQLRGRVGRGGRRGVCVLYPTSPLLKTAENRLTFLRNEHDGWAIAQYDLKTRGSGNLWGTEQSGWEAYNFFNPVRDSSMIHQSSAFAESLAPETGECLASIFFPEAKTYGY